MNPLQGIWKAAITTHKTDLLIRRYNLVAVTSTPTSQLAWRVQGPAPLWLSCCFLSNTIWPGAFKGFRWPDRSLSRTRPSKWHARRRWAGEVVETICVILHHVTHSSNHLMMKSVWRWPISKGRESRTCHNVPGRPQVSVCRENVCVCGSAFLVLLCFCLHRCVSQHEHGPVNLTEQSGALRWSSAAAVDECCL